jgi:hypothetical protein
MACSRTVLVVAGRLSVSALWRRSVIALWRIDLVTLVGSERMGSVV